MFKKLMLCTMVFVLLVGVSSALTLRCEWEFEGNLNDTSGSGYHGSYDGGSPVYSADTPGVAGGQSIYLDGVDDRVIHSMYADGSSLIPWTNTTEPVYDNARLEDATLSFWAKCNAGDDGSYTGIAGWGDYGRTCSQFVYDRGSSFYQYGTNHAFGPQADGEWQMITYVFDLDDSDGVGHSDSVYLNGQLVSTDGGHNLARAGDINIAVGWADKNASAYWKGYIDHFQIFEGAATSAEVEAMYNAVIPEPATIALLGLGGLALSRRRR